MRSRLSSLRALAVAGLGASLGLRTALRARRYAFRGKTVLVTGGTRGLGLVLARRFAAEGAQVAICGRDSATLERARVDLEASGARVLALACDVREPAEVARLVAQVHEGLGPVDVLVNNAGVIRAGPLGAMTLEDFQEAMDTHFWAALHTTLAVLPGMRERREGRIVNIASIGGKVAMPHLLPYDASKFALVGLSDGLRAELAEDGILVTTVCPGLMRTGSPRNASFKGDHEAEYAWFAVSDALPLLTLSAERAAQRIVEACRRGDAELVLGLHYRLAALVRALAPNLTAALLAQAHRLLPHGTDPGAHRGADSETPLTRSWLTALSREAATRNNELH